MEKSECTASVQYEFDVHVPLLDDGSSYKVCDITLTEDDFNLSLQTDQATWKQVDRFQVVNTEVKKVRNSFAETVTRVSGLFDADPLDWKYANIVVKDEKSRKSGCVRAKMPVSPIKPVIFFFDLEVFNKEESEDV
ncbi:MAG: hypothetical protein GY941_03230 [Planctomycetes bacterium]|nr:hypothetical protein [Planctomycetota bacterium]